jgi:2-polyprenyl-3-methyl-5-hydroxy-6-metoxy-1,4-benzoquinol methylase
MNKSQHKYEYSVSKKNHGTNAGFIFNYLRNAQTVLELGPGPGSITKVLVKELGCKITAVEVDESVRERLSEYCEHVVIADLNDDRWSDNVSNNSYDAVLAADVLEHLYAPHLVLEKMSNLIHEDGAIIVSLPHVAHCVIHACLIDEDFEYREWGLLDKTHIRFFGLKNMQSLFSNAGLKIVDAQFVIREPEDTEYASRWSKLKPEIQSMLKALPHSMVYQCVIKAKHISSAEPEIDLMTINTQVEPLSTLGRLKRLIKRHLPESFYLKLRNWYLERQNK